MDVRSITIYLLDDGMHLSTGDGVVDADVMAQPDPDDEQDTGGPFRNTRNLPPGTYVHVDDVCAALEADAERLADHKGGSCSRSLRGFAQRLRGA